MSTTVRIFRHPAKPQWGHGVLQQERDGKLILQWEDGQEHVVASAFRDKLESVALTQEEQSSMEERILGKRAAAPRAKRPSKKKGPPAVQANFDEQLRRFTLAFPDGFRGTKFTTAERGASGGKPAERQVAIDLARTLLDAGRLADVESGFAAAHQLLAETTFLFPIEGHIPFRSVKPEDKAELVAALRDLLHGSGEVAARFDRLVAALKLTDKAGAAKRPTWPLSTIFAGLYDPTAHVFVKPKLLQEQAAILGVPVDYAPLPSGKAYVQFQQVVAKVLERLRAAGQDPRDSMDAVIFTWTTLGSLAPAPVAAPVVQDNDD